MKKIVYCLLFALLPMVAGNAQVETLSVKKAGTAPVVDGDISEWGVFDGVEDDDEKVFKDEKLWNDWVPWACIDTNFSSFKAVWNEEYLYLAYKVSEADTNIVSVTQDAYDADNTLKFEVDRIDVAIGTDPDERVTDGITPGYGYSETIFGSLFILGTFFPVGDELPTTFFAYEYTGSGYTMEIEIPWKDLDFHPSGGSRLLFETVVVDVDGVLNDDGNIQGWGPFQGWGGRPVVVEGHNSPEIFHDMSNPGEIVLSPDYSEYFPVGVNETEHDISLIIAPNPALSNITVEATKRINNLKVISITGQVLKDVDVNGTMVELYVDDLCKGLYFLQVSAGSDVSTKKFLKR